MKNFKTRFVVCTIVALLMPLAARAAEPIAEPQVLDLVEGHLQLPVPAGWKKVKPRSRIVEHEFSIPAVGDDEIPGRMTIMAAHGDLASNITRWVGQFRSADGNPVPEEDKKVGKKTISGLEVHVVDISGHYQDKPRGPFGPTVVRPNTRMLAAIVPTEGKGTWFIKLYGPQETITAAKKLYDKMLVGIVWKAE